MSTPTDPTARHGTADWLVVAGEVASRWEHGHDELTEGCALCQAEYAEALRLARLINQHQE